MNSRIASKRLKKINIWRCEESNPEPMTMRCALLYQLSYIPILYLIGNTINFIINHSLVYRVRYLGQWQCKGRADKGKCG